MKQFAAQGSPMLEGEDQITATPSLAFRAYWGALLTVLGLLVGAFVAFGELPAPAALGLFAILVIVAEHRDQLFGDETSMSGSIVIALAAVVAFSDTAFLAGPFIAAALAGLYWPHIRRREYSKVVVNAASMSLAALFAAAAFHVCVTYLGDEVVALIVGSTLAAIVFWAVNNIVVALAVTLLRGGRVGRVFHALIRSEIEMLGFAFLGALCGYVFVELAWWAGISCLIGLLVVLDRLVIRRPAHSRSARRAATRATAMRLAIVFMAMAALGVMAVREPVPPLGSLLPLVAVGAVASLLCSRAADDVAIAVTVATSVLAGVVLADSSPLLGPMVIGLVAGVGPVLVRRQRLDVRCGRAAVCSLSGLAVGTTYSAVPTGARSLVSGLVAALIAASAAGLLVHGAALIAVASARIGRPAISVGIGVIVAELWVIAVAAVVGLAAWYVPVAGGALIVGGAIGAALRGRRRHTEPDRPVPIVDPDDVLAAVVRALRDRPATPTAVSPRP